MRKKKSTLQAGVQTYSPKEIIEMEMIIATLARDDNPFTLQQYGEQYTWECRYCLKVHRVKQDRYGWPAESNVRRLSHGHECPWYWARVWQREHATVSWPTLSDPRQTKPVPQTPPLHRRMFVPTPDATPAVQFVTPIEPIVTPKAS